MTVGAASSCLALFAGFAFLSVPLFAAEQPSGGVIAGSVRNGWTNAPIKRATITLATSGASPLEALTYSDSSGAFAFTGVPGGRYYLHADLMGYTRGAFGRQDIKHPAVALVLAPGEVRQNIVLKMLPLGSISGMVTDPDGDPVARAEVHLLRATFRRRVPQWTSVRVASTDGRGEYHLTSVVPGQYRVMAVRNFNPGQEMASDVTYGQKLTERMLGVQFFPNSDSPENAAAVNMKPGNEITEIDFSLPYVSRAHVSGGISFEGRPGQAEPVQVSITPLGPAPLRRTIATNAAPPDYRFRFEGLIPGPYRLVASLETEGRHYQAVHDIDAAQSLDDVILSMVPGSPLIGSVSVEKGGVLPEGCKVALTPGDRFPFAGGPPAAEVRPDGSFEFPDLLPGVWDIKINPVAPGMYVKSISLGGEDVLTADMVLRAGSRPRLSILLGARGATIKGSVLPATGTGAAARRAIVLLAPGDKFADVLSFYRVKSTDENGGFEFTGVRPGGYRIFAFDEMEPQAFWDPEFLKPYVASAETFNVSEGAVIARDAPLIITEGGQ